VHVYVPCQLATAQEKAARNEEAAKAAATLKARVEILEDERTRCCYLIPVVVVVSWLSALHCVVALVVVPTAGCFVGNVCHSLSLPLSPSPSLSLFVFCSLAEAVKDVVVGTTALTGPRLHTDLESVMQYLRALQQERVSMMEAKGASDAKAAGAARTAEVNQRRVTELVRCRCAHVISSMPVFFGSTSTRARVLFVPVSCIELSTLLHAAIHPVSPC
jgi:hypothetical protein